MMPLLLMRAAKNARMEVKIILVTLVIVLLLPIIGVIALGSDTLSILALGFSSGESLYQGPVSPTDLYDWGNCTYWAALLRQQAGKPIPNDWGNAATWAIRALLAGYVVDHTPSPTAIMQTPDAAKGLGHVAFVESVDPGNGTWTISEMNVKGYDIVDTQTLPASAANNYSFIHDKVIRKEDIP